MQYDPSLSSPEAGLYRYWDLDSDGNSVVVTKQDVAPILEHNKKAQSVNDGYSPSREWRRVATIPNNIAVMLQDQYGVKDIYSHHNRDLLKRVLNDADYADLRSAPGRL